MTAVAEENIRGTRRTHRSMLREALRVPDVAPAVVAAYRPRAAPLAQRIIARIGREVTGFAMLDDEVVRSSVHEAITSAVDLFVDTVAGAPTHGTEVFAFYRWLGQFEAQAGHNLDAMQAAHHIATQESWEDLRHAATDLDVAPAIRGPLGDALIAYQNMLYEQALMGFMDVRTNATREREEQRTELFLALLAGAPCATVRELADRCSWALPTKVCAAVCAATDEAVAVASTTPEALSGVRHGRLLVVAEPQVVARLAHRVAADAGEDVAVSWGVTVDEAHHAVRWASRGLDLLRDGVVEPPPNGVLHCEDHTSRLCLHADPALRQLSDQVVLAPLLEQTPKRRVALAETMLLWLQTRESAPALAARLGIHDQTVRHRLRRVRELFGARLNDPSQTTVLLVALESSITSWRRSVA